MTRFDLYEWCVQAPELQARFLRALHPGSPRILIEDFCGPASIARAWCLLDARFRALGIDRDTEPLTHAARRASEQGIGRPQFRGVRADVRRAKEKGDIIAAFNFAVCELHVRKDLLAYLRRARLRLKQRGIFACDLYAGRDAFRPSRSTVTRTTPAGPVRYTWEQRSADVLAARVENAIHFRLLRGKEMRDAFVYDWRLWSIAELRDALFEAGFASSEVHLSYGEAIDADGNPVPVAAAPGDALDENFVAYVVART